MHRIATLAVVAALLLVSLFALSAPFTAARADVAGLSVYGRVIGISPNFDGEGACRLQLAQDGLNPTTVDIGGKFSEACDSILFGEWLLIPAAARPLLCGPDICSIFFASDWPVTP